MLIWFVGDFDVSKVSLLVWAITRLVSCQNRWAGDRVSEKLKISSGHKVVDLMRQLLVYFGDQSQWPWVGKEDVQKLL